MKRWVNIAASWCTWKVTVFYSINNVKSNCDKRRYIWLSSIYLAKRIQPNTVIFELWIEFNKKWFAHFSSSFTNSGSSNRAMELPMNGGGSHGGFNNGMNPFPYSNSMHNNMYMPNSNSYRSNDRSSRQVQQQAFNRNRNIRRGRRLSRRGKLNFFVY